MQQITKILTGAVLMVAVIGTGSPGFGGGSDPEDVRKTVAAPPSASRFPRRVDLVVGFADIRRIDGDISTILLGNPGIVDASPVDSRMILLNGQAAGMTNMIVLDDSGDILADLMLYVSGRQPGTVTVRRALELQTYSCASGLCEGGTPRGAGLADTPALTSTQP